jgi:hypothetical protein
MGNPPYNKGGIRSHTGKQLGDKNETIWPDFIKYAFEHLNDNGFLVYINPLSWLKKSHSMHKKLLDNHIVWLKLWDNSKAKQEINADIPLSLYVMHNKKNKKKCKSLIISQLKRRGVNSESNVYIHSDISVPLASHSIFDKILNKIEENDDLILEVFTSTVKGGNDKIKLPEKYTAKDLYGIDTYRIKDGYFVKKMLSEHKDQTKKKLIIANKSSLNGTMIDDGKLGLVGSDKFYILGDKLEILQTFFETNLCEIISHFTKYRQDFLEKEAFSYIPDIRQILKKKFDLDEIYKYFEFTKEEINTINNFKKCEDVKIKDDSNDEKTKKK